MAEFLHGEITGKVIGAACEVWRVLGYGFLEKVYQNALAVEFKIRSVSVEPQREMAVNYKGHNVGEYVVDFMVEGKVVVELKAEKEYNPEHEAQLLNYLKATGVRVGLLVNFGQAKCSWQRFVMGSDGEPGNELPGKADG